jgi:hypothetical protein
LIESKEGHVIGDILSPGISTVIFSNDSKSLFSINYDHSSRYQSVSISNLSFETMYSSGAIFAKTNDVSNGHGYIGFSYSKDSIYIYEEGGNLTIISRTSSPTVTTRKYSKVGNSAQYQAFSKDSKFAASIQNDSNGYWIELGYDSLKTSTFIKVASDSLHKQLQGIESIKFSPNSGILATSSFVYDSLDKNLINRTYKVYDISKKNFTFKFSFSEDSISLKDWSRYGIVYDNGKSSDYNGQFTFTPDSKYIVTRKDTTGITLRSLVVDSNVKTISGIKNPIDIYGFTPDSKYVFVGSGNKNDLIKIDIENYEEQNLTSHSGNRLKSMSDIYSDTSTVVSIGSEGKVLFGDLKTGSIKKTFYLSNEIPSWFKYGSLSTLMGVTKDLERLIFGNRATRLGSDTTSLSLKYYSRALLPHADLVVGYDTINSFLIAQLSNDSVLWHKAYPKDIDQSTGTFCTSRNGKYIIAYTEYASGDFISTFHAHIYEVNTGKKVGELLIDSIPFATQRRSGMSISSDGRQIALTGQKGGLYDIQTNKLLKQMFFQDLTQCCYSIDDRYLFLTLKDNISVYDIIKDSIIKEYSLGKIGRQGFDNSWYNEFPSIVSIDLSPDDAYITCMAKDGSVACFKNDISTVSVKTHEAVPMQTLTVTPSPTSNNILVTIPISETCTAEEEIINMLGVPILHSTRLLPAGITEYKLNVSELPDGIYFYRLKKGQTCFSQKFIISHN